MSDSYSFQGGTFDPVEQVDVMPEQEKDNARIERSEAEYFDALRKNDQAEVDNTTNLWKSLSKFSKSVEGFADEIYKKRKEEDMAKGAIAAVNSPYNYEDLNMLFNEEEDMKNQDIELSRIGGEVEQETGRFVLGKEIRDMSGWELHSFKKNMLLREAGTYTEFKRASRTTAFVTIDGEKVGYGEGMRPPANDAEADGLDGKIRAQFVSRYGWASPVLLQATIKKEIDRVDKKDQEARNTEFDTKAKELRETNERLDLVENIKADPSGGRASVDHWVSTNLHNYGGSLELTRRGFSDVLVSAVQEGDIPLHQALATVQHGILHRGTKKTEDMTIFKEWRDLESRLMEANTKYMDDTEDDRKNAMLADIEAFKTIENPTVATRADFVRGLNDKYPGMAIPDEGYNIVYGYKDDDQMEQYLERVAAGNGGVVTEKHLEGASPKIRNDWRTKTVADNQSQIGSVADLGTGQVKYVRNRVAETLDLVLGEGQTTSLEYDTLLRNTNEAFVAEYNLVLQAEKDPAKAKFMAEQKVISLLGNQAWRNKNTQRVYSNDDLGRQKALNNAQTQIKPATGNWRITKLDVPSEEKEELKAWTLGGGEGPVPSYYAGIAYDNNIFPKELASAQAALHGFEPPQVDYKALEKIPPNVKHLLMYKPTPTKVEIAKKELEIFKNKDAELVPLWKLKRNLREGV
nr:hypothetical protein [uncultured Mediterranean phage uvMED]BAR27111.1 hypothetical protein [uncultured Mediterranean phage uvMED]